MSAALARFGSSADDRSVRVSCQTIALYRDGRSSGSRQLGLALVGDPDGREITRPVRPQRSALRDDFLDARRNLEWIVLDPSGPRKDLPVFELMAGTTQPQASRTP